MTPLTIALNVFFCLLVLTTIVGGLVWAVLSSRREDRHARTGWRGRASAIARPRRSAVAGRSLPRSAT